VNAQHVGRGPPTVSFEIRQVWWPVYWNQVSRAVVWAEYWLGHIVVPLLLGCCDSPGPWSVPGGDTRVP
jgi:hypothetical protein